MPMKPVKAASAKKNPPILSHEFVLQNHADIVSCVAMVFIIGLMFQITQPLASAFIAMQHNATLEGIQETFYTPGWKDNLSVFFYALIAIVIHAVIQEYGLDKINRKLHLSKVKHSRFNESGQLAVFFLATAAWGLNIIVSEPWGLTISSLWKGYPHIVMPFIMKFFFIVQLAYWVHWPSEFYFQKIKQEEHTRRLSYILPYLVATGILYLTNFSRLGIWLLTLQYLPEGIHHVARLFHYAEKEIVAKQAFTIFSVVFITARLASIALAGFTFLYGLPQEAAGLDLAAGNFNTMVFRVSALAAIVLFQFYLLVKFVRSRASRLAESGAVTGKVQKVEKKQKKPVEKKAKKESKKSGDEDISDLPEADQHKPRSRPGKAKA